MAEPLWTPSPERIAASRMTAFTRALEARHRVALPDYASLYEFSLARMDDFWRFVWEFGGIRGSMGDRIVEDRDRMPGARFFPDATLNYAENLLRRRADRLAIVFKGEGQPTRSVTFAELYASVAGFANGLRRAGIQRGDRVAGYVPNMPEAIVATLGAAAIGAVWSSCSP